MFLTLHFNPLLTLKTLLTLLTLFSVKKRIKNVELKIFGQKILVLKILALKCGS